MTLFLGVQQLAALHPESKSEPPTIQFKKGIIL